MQRSRRAERWEPKYLRAGRSKFRLMKPAAAEPVHWMQGLAAACAPMLHWMQEMATACAPMGHWMQELAAAAATELEWPALWPQARVRLPPDNGLSIQDGWDPVEVAREGRLESLQRLAEAGRFLDLHSPHRAAAGEACRAQAWLAALAACKAGHAHVLRWIFRVGWPSSFDAQPPWHLADMAESWIKDLGTVQRQGYVDPCDHVPHVWRLPKLPCYPPEVELYRAAMRAPACLDAMLEAGARSGWICRAAVLEGRPDLLALSIERGCPCDAECLFSAAREGQVEVLEALLLLKVDVILKTTNRVFHGLYKMRYCRPIWAATLVQQAALEAAARGHHACLEALLRWHGNLSCDCSEIPRAAARAGHLTCLQLLQRGGLKVWRGTLRAAASKPDNLPCLRFALRLDPFRQQFEFSGSCRFSPEEAMEAAAQAGSLANLEALHEASYPWTGHEVMSAIESGKVDVVDFCLEHMGDARNPARRFRDWAHAMRHAIHLRSPAMMQVLYDLGYRPKPSSDDDHPVSLAIEAGMLEGAKIAVKYSGVPKLGRKSRAAAARGGEALLRYVHGLCGTLGEETAIAAAWCGQLGSLQYAVQNGAPWDRCTLEAAILADSLGCLRYAHEGGCPHHALGISPEFVAARSLPVLRYVCEHMGPTWSAKVLRDTAARLSDSIRARTGESFDWQMALYTAQQFVRSGRTGMWWWDLPAPLAKAVRVRRERAAALAGAFYRAGQLEQVGAAHSWAPLWRSMASVPCELRQKIAFMAHLVLPPPFS